MFENIGKSAQSRKHPRFSIVEDIPVDLWFASGVIQGKLLNLSSEGFAVVIDEDHAGESRLSSVEVRIKHPEGDIVLEGAIVNKGDHGTSQTRLGGTITNISEENRLRFMGLISNIVSTQGLSRTISRRRFNQEDLFPASQS